jgi:hypothetical protein
MYGESITKASAVGEVLGGRVATQEDRRLTALSEAKRIPGIAEGLNDLSSAISSAEEALSMLRERLVPVTLASTPRDTGNKTPQPDRPTSEVAQALQLYIMRVRSLRAMAEDALQRLDI